MDLGLRERVALVTGSSRGIGRATAEMFAREGARVAITYRSQRQSAENAADAIRRFGGEAMVVSFDLADPASIRQAVEAIVANWGRLDILVNNAVMWPRALEGAPALVAADTVDDWQCRLRANIEGAIITAEAAVPWMRSEGWGRIVNISSSAADGMSGFAWYSSAKAALHGLTRTQAKELGQAGILANAVMPSLTLTERVHQRFDAVPRRRLLQPDEIAATVVFLCSAANTGITGEVVRIVGRRH